MFQPSKSRIHTAEKQRRIGLAEGHIWIFVFAIFAFPSSAFATAGFAEWEVYTPGGNLVSHVDGWKEQHGDCIRTDDRSAGSKASTVLVDHIKRWRYYEGYVAGEREGNFFLLNEVSGSVETFTTESHLTAAIEKLKLGGAISPWLSGGDGWSEAWFLYTTWAECRGGKEANAQQAYLNGMFGASAKQCREATSKETLRLFKRTTWGRACVQMREEERKGLSAKVKALHDSNPDAKASWLKQKALLESLCSAMDAA